MKLIARRGVAMALAVALIALFTALLLQAEGESRDAAEDLHARTAAAAADAVDTWFDAHLAWQRAVTFDLSSHAPPSSADAAAALLASKVEGSTALFSLWLDADGRVIATYPVRDDLPPGMPMAGAFPHVDAVLAGAPLGLWSTDAAATDSGLAMATVTRLTAAGDILSVAFDPAATLIVELGAAAAGAVDGAHVRLVEPVTGVVLARPSALPAAGAEVMSVTSSAVQGLLEVTVSVARADLYAAVGGVVSVPGRIGLVIVALLQLAAAVAVPRSARRSYAIEADAGRVAALFDRAQTPSLLLDAQQRIVRANQRFTEVTGWTEAQLAGTDPLTSVLAHDDVDRAALAAVTSAATVGAEPASTVREHRYVTSGGEERHGRISAASVAAPDGTPLGSLLQISDLTDLVHTQEALAQSREQLQRFAARVAHDLTNPLTAANGMAQLLGTTDFPEEQRAIVLERVAASTGAALDLVQRLFWTADRVGAEAWGLVDLREVVDWLSRLTAAALAESRGSLDLDIDQPRVVAPAETLRTVLANLVDNALKYRRPEVAPRITIRDMPDETQLHLVVSDNGSGVDASLLDSIFERGMRATDVAEDTDGHGSGLADCRRLLEDVGGSIWAEVGGTGGLDMHVTLPLGAAVQPQGVGASVLTERAVFPPG